MATAITNSKNYRSKVHISIKGSVPPDEFLEKILQVVVEESIHLPGVFTIAVGNARRTDESAENTMTKYADLFEIGNEVVIGFDSSVTDAAPYTELKSDPKLLVGEITAVEVPFSKRAQSPIIIRGYDYSHRLHRGRWNRSFIGETDSSIATKLAREAGIAIGQIDDSGIVHDYLFQENQTNMEFLRERAALIGFEVFVQKGKFYFRKPIYDQDLKLDWLEYIDNFRVRLNSIEQIKQVEVRGWDYVKKTPIVSRANAQSSSVITKLNSHSNPKGELTASKFGGKPAEQVFYVVDRPVETIKEADIIAQACCDEIRGQYIHADIEGEGNPEIRPGKRIILEDKAFATYRGKYYVAETRHVYQPDRERTYTTEFVIRGLRNSNILNALAPSHNLQPGQTLLAGIVTDNKDPENMARVKVKFPTLTEEHNSHWARVVSIGAGKDRGMDWLPEIDDEVLVGFEHGDIRRPYIVGSVWNGVDVPPERIEDSVVGGKVRLRTLKTRTGHQIQFVEEDKDDTKAGIYIDTSKDHSIHFNDSDRFIQITSKEGNTIRIDDRDKNITIETNGGHKIVLNDASKQIELNSSGNLSITAKGNIDINATGTISLQGALIKLN